MAAPPRLGGVLLVAACSTERDPETLFAPDAVGVLVVEAVLIVDQPLPAAPDPDPATGRALHARDTGAEVVINHPHRSRVYGRRPATGRVHPRSVARWVGPADPVLPRSRYDLLVVTAEGEELRATTLTPGHFVSTMDAAELRTAQTNCATCRPSPAGDAVYDHPDNQLATPRVCWRPASSARRRRPSAPFGFQLALFSLDPDSPYVIDPPFWTKNSSRTCRRRLLADAPRRRPLRAVALVRHLLRGPLPVQGLRRGSQLV